MAEIDYYEDVRQKLTLGPLYAPNHKKIIELMKIFWTEEEIEILSHFDSADKSISLRGLEKRSGIPKDQIKAILEPLVKKGTISHIATKYCLIPLLPGIFEKYFIARADTEENQKKAAEIYRWMFKELLPSLFYETGLKIFRPRLPVDAKEKLIKIDESIPVESQILPFELIMQLIEDYDDFSYITCQCRLIGDLTGEPCEVAPAEMGCFLAGTIAQGAIKAGAPRLNKEEAIEYLKKTEKAGLIHSCVADNTVESTLFVCNCCSCHCGALVAAKEHKYSATIASNYVPRIDGEICTKCDTCLKKCPMGAIYHIYPNQPDKSDEHMKIREEYCIGCGVCATNCPNNAIKLVKVRDNLFSEKHKIGNKTFGELLS